MLARFAFLVLLCALVVPNAAWGAHVSGHERLSALASVHTHHDEHAHEQADDTTADDQQDRDQEVPQKGLTHDHSPSHSLTGGMLVSADPESLPWQASGILHFDRSSVADALSRPGSLLRPPRRI